MMVVIDCRGQQCPQPVVQVRRQLLATPDAALQVLVSDPAARDNVGRLATGSGYRVVVTEADGAFRLDLTPAAAATERATTPASGPTVILVAADQIGQGDPQLGQVLMKNYIFTLLDGHATPDLMLFVNGGARLTVTGSEVLEPLQQLADRGTDIATCGLCLEFFHLKEALAVGRVSNMLEIVNALQGAGRVIRP
jgi:selenium metabolism protein YedF